MENGFISIPDVNKPVTLLVGEGCYDSLLSLMSERQVVLSLRGNELIGVSKYSPLNGAKAFPEFVLECSDRISPDKPVILTALNETARMLYDLAIFSLTVTLKTSDEKAKLRERLVLKESVLVTRDCGCCCDLALSNAFCYMAFGGLGPLHDLKPAESFFKTLLVSNTLTAKYR